MPCYLRNLLLFSLLWLSACGTTAETAPHDPNLFVPKSGQAKIFLFATYGAPENKPYFEHHFQFLVSGYEQTINDQEFIVTNMNPDGYHVHVDEYDWGGNIINSQTLTAGLQEGKIYFFTAHSISDKLTLTATPDAEGRREVLTRNEKCLCIQPFRKTLEDVFGF